MLWRNNMQALVMGGTGWVGHFVALELAKRDIPVTILTRGKRQTFVDEVKGIPLIHADKEDEAAMAKIFQTRYTHVIDTVPTKASIEWVATYAKGLRHYIHCSSTGGYAPLPYIPCNENAPYGGFEPTTGWAQKRIVDALVMDKFMNRGFPGTVLRPCYITGPGMLPLDNLGDRRPEFIPDILAERPIILPNDGQALLQPIYVKELARAFALAVEHPHSIGQVYNICLDHAVTLNRYVELNALALNRKPHIVHMDVEEILRKHRDLVPNVNGLRFLATHMCFDISKARRDLDFQPRITPEEAIEETAVWAAAQLKS
jgi:nucleoside-diphosphate-sugar epimerase